MESLLVLGHNASNWRSVCDQISYASAGIRDGMTVLDDESLNERLAQAPRVLVVVTPPECVCGFDVADSDVMNASIEHWVNETQALMQIILDFRKKIVVVLQDALVNQEEVGRMLYGGSSQGEFCLDLDAEESHDYVSFLYALGVMGEHHPAHSYFSQILAASNMSVGSGDYRFRLELYRKKLAGDNETKLSSIEELTRNILDVQKSYKEEKSSSELAKIQTCELLDEMEKKRLEKEALSVRLLDLEGENKNFVSSLTDLQNEKLELAELLGDYKLEVEALQKKQLQDEENFNEIIDSLNQEVVNARDDAESTRRDLDKSMAENQSHKANLIAQENRYQSTIDDLRQSIAELENQLKEKVTSMDMGHKPSLELSNMDIDLAIKQIEILQEELERLYLESEEKSLGETSLAQMEAAYQSEVPTTTLNLIESVRDNLFQKY